MSGQLGMSGLHWHGQTTREVPEETFGEPTVFLRMVKEERRKGRKEGSKETSVTARERGNRNQSGY